MKKIFGKLCMGGVLLFSLSMLLTSCEDILGHWEKPTPNPITPGGGSEGGGSSTINATAITLDQKMKVLVKGGDALTIKVNFTPSDATDKSVTWTSDDPNIATVDNGVVTPVGLGITTITAKSGELSATCEVFVGNVVDLSSVGGYSPDDYDILTGTLSNQINILGRKVAFDGMAADNIECFYDVTIYLTDGKTNTVAGVGANKAGIRVGGAGTTLTINAETLGTGKLNVTGSDDGAGIGTGYACSGDIVGGNIVINGGVINATGGKWNGGAAGIGTGFAENYKNECGAITINGGVINATGSYKKGFGGAGIGTGGAHAKTGSTSNKCGAITINGGTVTATGAERAAGIGTGTSYYDGAASNNTCGAITIDTGITSVAAIKGDQADRCIGEGPGFGSSPTVNCGVIKFGTASVFDGASPGTWDASIIFNTNGDYGPYGGLNLNISTTTNANDTWTLTPAP